MANPKAIGDIVKKCKILLLDIEGTTTSISFVKNDLFPYVLENVKSYLEAEWETDDVKEAVAALRKLALEDQQKSIEGVVNIPGEDATKADQIEALVGSVTWQMAADRKEGALKLLQGLIWKQGYETGDIKGHVFDDVSPALQLWRTTEGNKVYIYSSGSVEAQKLLFSQSLAGDLLEYIDGHFDTAVGAKQEAASYKKIVEEIGCKAEEVLFLTDIDKEATAATAAGLRAALVSRAGNAPLAAEAAATFPVLHTLAQLAASNKRKTDDQEVHPAKIPKTDNADVVTSSADDASAKTEKVETDKMEVDNESASKEAEPMEESKDSPITETKVEEITDSNEAVNATPVETKPIITEAIDSPENKTEEKPVSTDDVSEASAQVVVTEIEEVSDKLADVADIMEELQPAVEEPPSGEEEMAELQTVGEVLEKECDEILSKVQDVTNLGNIGVKHLLTPISEEIETENVDSNDIVDRILDTELEMEMRSEDLAKEAAKAAVKDPEEKPEEVANNGETEKAAEATTDSVPEDVIAEPVENKPVEANGECKVEPEKIESTKEETPEKSKTEETTETKTIIPEVQLNGKAINGNGGAKDELTRLTENGKELNGTNGDAVEETQGDAMTNGGVAEVGQGDAKPEAEIKVKSVAAAQGDPPAQPTEA